MPRATRAVQSVTGREDLGRHVGRVREYVLSATEVPLYIHTNPDPEACQQPTCQLIRPSNAVQYKTVPLVGKFEILVRDGLADIAPHLAILEAPKRSHCMMDIGGEVRCGIRRQHTSSW